MKVGDLVSLGGRPAIIIDTKTGNINFVYVITHRGYKIMINKEHLQPIDTTQ